MKIPFRAALEGIAVMTVIIALAATVMYYGKPIVAQTIQTNIKKSSVSTFETLALFCPKLKEPGGACRLTLDVSFEQKTYRYVDSHEVIDAE